MPSVNASFCAKKTTHASCDDPPFLPCLICSRWHFDAKYPLFTIYSTDIRGSALANLDLIFRHANGNTRDALPGASPASIQALR